MSKIEIKLVRYQVNKQLNNQKIINQAEKVQTSVNPKKKSSTSPQQKITWNTVPRDVQFRKKDR